MPGSIVTRKKNAPWIADSQPRRTSQPRSTRKQWSGTCCNRATRKSLNHKGRLLVVVDLLLSDMIKRCWKWPVQKLTFRRSTEIDVYAKHCCSLCKKEGTHERKDLFRTPVKNIESYLQHNCLTRQDKSFPSVNVWWIVTLHNRLDEPCRPYFQGYKYFALKPLAQISQVKEGYWYSYNWVWWNETPWSPWAMQTSESVDNILTTDAMNRMVIISKYDLTVSDGLFKKNAAKRYAISYPLSQLSNSPLANNLRKTWTIIQ